MLAGGVDIKALSEYLGRYSAAFTLATWAHVMPSASDANARGSRPRAHGEADGPATPQGVSR